MTLDILKHMLCKKAKCNILVFLIFLRRKSMDEHLLHLTAAIVALSKSSATQAEACDLHIYNLLKCLDDELCLFPSTWCLMLIIYQAVLLKFASRRELCVISSLIIAMKLYEDGVHISDASTCLSSCFLNLTSLLETTPLSMSKWSYRDSSSADRRWSF